MFYHIVALLRNWRCNFCGDCLSFNETHLRRAVGSKATLERSKRGFCFLGKEKFMRTFIYVDGFNLYHRMLQGNGHLKWLNLKELSEKVLRPENVVSRVNYYTARVSARLNPDGPKNQQKYLDALETVPEIKIHYGNFQVNKKYSPLVPCHPDVKPIFQPWPSVVRVIKTEEKGSDVNLAAHLVRDAFRNAFDVAAVITNDTDLVEPIRIVIEELQKPVGILSPVTKPAKDLKDVASFLRFIRPAQVSQSQFPDSIHRPNTTPIVRPSTWL
ncbi:NYN domain-containing protein [Jiella mangrovi]|uniref:NYN domain-containing protein n=1 Tax=Jiella mangrovi TaxID=2821407 RepID=A0ABS4BNI2_9HYPH|nr:NYN domain-containing protein [Jiella mangrovi]MBP0618311.1 NYN domain-containing protein [Jiella mangrovi]